ncbi:MAG TPA: hypothetical protein VK578_09785 [Edaphobacter sp.]|nr:hypothetical protein [Edaphobacter sp.]
MTIAETLLQDYDIEISNTRRTLERVPKTRTIGSVTTNPWN